MKSTIKFFVYMRSFCGTGTAGENSHFRLWKGCEKMWKFIFLRKFKIHRRKFTHLRHRHRRRKFTKIQVFIKIYFTLSSMGKRWFFAINLWQQPCLQHSSNTLFGLNQRRKYKWKKPNIFSPKIPKFSRAPSARCPPWSHGVKNFYFCKKLLLLPMKSNYV